MKKGILFYITIFITVFLIPYSNVNAAEYQLKFTRDDSNKCQIGMERKELTYFKRTNTMTTNKDTRQRIVYCYDEADAFPVHVKTEILTWTCKPMEQQGLGADEILKLKYVIATGFNSESYNNSSSTNKSTNSCDCTGGNINEDKCSNYKRYLETQKAVWNISSSSSSTKSYDSELTTRANNYFSAKGGSEIKLAVNDEYMYLDGDYYVSDLINITSDYTGEMSIELPSNFFAVDINNQRVTTVKSGDRIRVKIESDKIPNRNINVKVKYSYDKNSGDIYLCTHNGQSNIWYNVQKLVWYEPQKETVEISKTLKLKMGYRCDNNYQNPGELVCNQNKSYSSTCNHLTINVKNYVYKDNKYNFFSNITLNQTGNITSILNPERTYSGGGFNFDVIYHNQISWGYYNSGSKVCKDNNGNDCTDKLDELIESILINQKILNLEDYKNNIKLNNIKFGNSEFNKGIIKKCVGEEKFTNKTMTSVCVFTLPKEEMDNQDGIVSRYITDEKYLNTKNKHYTPLNYEGKYKITADISDFSRLKNNPQDNIGAKPWFGDWKDTFSNCEIYLYPLLYKNNNKYVFIYRPIDLNNPFPNRNPGMNWYDWYNVQRNKERLESSYSREQYSITLDSSLTSEIKKYNRDELAKGGYFDWKTIENGQSSFIDKYFDKKRDNIVGDNS